MMPISKTVIYLDILYETSLGFSDPIWLPDDKIVYIRYDTEDWEVYDVSLWIVESNGNNPKEIGKLFSSSYEKLPNYSVERGLGPVRLYGISVSLSWAESEDSQTPWDVNGDSVVDISDLVIVGKHFGEAVEDPMAPNPDVNRDGIVDISDLVLVGIHFGESTGK